jgi:hypothetical protein
MLGKGNRRAVLCFSECSTQLTEDYLHERARVEQNSRTLLGSQPLFPLP